jgi:hypothetical protein
MPLFCLSVPRDRFEYPAESLKAARPLAHTGADQISSFSDFVYTPVSNPRTKTSRRPGPQLASTARL